MPPEIDLLGIIALLKEAPPFSGGFLDYRVLRNNLNQSFVFYLINDENKFRDLCKKQ